MALRPAETNETAEVMASQSIPIFILTGFLGSGKTTFLNRLLRDPALHDTAVLVNELGEVGLDHLLVETIDEEIILLSSGCVCCSVRDDFSAALISLAEKWARGLIPTASRIVLETTGIADPAPLLQLIMDSRELSTRFHLGGVLTVIDGVLGERTLQTEAQAVLQAAMADTIIYSKTDLAEPDALERLKVLVQDHTDARAFIDASSNIDIAALFPRHHLDADGRRPARHHEGEPHHRHGFSTFLLTWETPLPWETFSAWLEGLLIARGEDIFRLKGLLHVTGHSRPFVVQGVQHCVYEPHELGKWPGGKPLTELVFIVRNFTRDAAIRSLQPFIDTRIGGSNGANVSLSRSSRTKHGLAQKTRQSITGLENYTVIRRPWHFAELHNPWSRVAQLIDAWSVLDMCHDPALIALVAGAIGPDIILFDTRLCPDPWNDNSNAVQYDWDCFPVRPLRGVTVVLPIGEEGEILVHRQTPNLTMETFSVCAGECALIDARQPYRIEVAEGMTKPAYFKIRYFPATSQYIRDSQSSEQLLLMERWPLINLAKVPLWLVAGEDRAENDFATGFSVKGGRWVRRPGKDQE
jgi:G3E family GTPase